MRLARDTDREEADNSALKRFCAFVCTFSALGVAILVLSYTPAPLHRVYRLADNRTATQLVRVTTCLDVLGASVSNATDVVLFVFGGNTAPHDSTPLLDVRTYGGNVTTAQCATPRCVSCMAEFAMSPVPASYPYVRDATALAVTRVAWDAAPRTLWRSLAQRNDSHCHSCYSVERAWAMLFTGRWAG